MARLVTVDLFAGAGGLSLGLHRAGLEMLFAVEKDPMAFETLAANFMAPSAPYPALQGWPEWLERKAHDIEVLLGDPGARARLMDLRGTIDLVCGGPPCQGFSVGGIRDGQDKRNLLPLRYLDFVHLVRPRALILENVEGMARKFVSKPGDRPQSFTDWLVSRLQEDGYDACCRIVDASDFGVPQIRKRVIVFGIRQDQVHPGRRAEDFFGLLFASTRAFVQSKGLNPDRPVTVREAIEDLNGERLVVCPDSPKFMSGTYKPPTSAYARLMRKGIPDSQVPDSHRFSNHGEETLQFYSKVHLTQPYGRLSKQFLLEHGTKKDKKVLIDPGAPSSTITTHPDEFIHYDHPRNISVREMARLQSFPDDFAFRGRYTINGPRRRFDVARCSQVGNAVPPLVAEALGLALIDFLTGQALPGRNGRTQPETCIQPELPLTPVVP